MAISRYEDMEGRLLNLGIGANFDPSQVQAAVQAAQAATDQQAQVQRSQQAAVAQRARQSQSRASASQLVGISKNPPYDSADVEKVKDLLNSGQVKVSEVSQYFDVPVNDVIKNLTGISRDTYNSGASTPETVSAVMNMINSGVASPAEVQEYFSTAAGEVEDYLINVEGYTPEDISNVQQGIAVASADVRNIPVDGDYTQQEIDTVATAINDGVMTTGQVARQFDVEEQYVIDNMKTINQRPSAAPAFTLPAAPAPAPAEDTKELFKENLLGGTSATDVGYARGDDIPTGLYGSEMALKGGASGAIEMLDQLNRAGQSSLTTQSQAGLAAAEQQKAIADAAIMSGTTQGLDALGAAVASGRTDLRDEYANALAAAEQQSIIARGDISAGGQAGRDAMAAAGAATRADLTGQYDTGLANAQAQAAIARGDILSGESRGMAALNQGLGEARQDITQGMLTGRQDITQGADTARQDITGAFDRAEGMFQPYQEAGTTALQQQLALSGALGQEAFNAAYQESPQMAFLREQGMRANLAGAGATGGLGGGNVQKELQRFGQGLASQGLQQQIGNLGALSAQGQNAAGSASNIATGRGTNLANIASGAGSNLSNIAMTGGGNLGNLGVSGGQAGLQSAMTSGGNLSNIATGLGAQQLGTRTNLGNQLGNMNMSLGQAQQRSFENVGSNLANVATGLGSQRYQAGVNLGGNLADMNMAQGQAQLGAYANQGSNLSNLATGLGSQQLQAQSNLGSQLANYNLSTGLPAVSAISNLGTNLASGRARVGEQLSNQYGAAATAMSNIYSDQGRNISGAIDAQRTALINQVNSGAISEAQAQTAYATAVANAQSNMGSALAGLQQTPLASPNYAQGVGNALQAGAYGYNMFNNNQPATPTNAAGSSGSFTNDEVARWNDVINPARPSINFSNPYTGIPQLGTYGT